MKIRKFWVQGYRSLRDVTLDDIGDFSVFYGPNGSGKSNVLDALQTLFYVMPLAVDTAYGPEEERLSFREAGERASIWIRDEDFFARAPTKEIAMGAIIQDSSWLFDPMPMQFQGKPVRRVEVAIRFSRPREGQWNLQFTRLYVNDQPPGLPFDDVTVRDLLRRLVPGTFTHLGVTRTLNVNALRDNFATPSPSVGTIPDGEVVREMFAAKNSRDPEGRRRFEQLREFMSKELHRGLCDVFLDSTTQTLELREMLPEPNPDSLDVRIDRAGHGVVQLYAILAPIMLSGGRLVAMEEPEAHLHAPTLGRDLRALLVRLVEERKIDQLFVATHSNLFDLDPSGYWDVSLVDGATHVERKRLSEIDAHHLYEPGPAKHALLQSLRYASAEEVVFRRPDG